MHSTVIPSLAVSFGRACKNMASTAAATSTFVQLGGIMPMLLLLIPLIRWWWWWWWWWWWSFITCNLLQQRSEALLLLRTLFWAVEALSWPSSKAFWTVTWDKTEWQTGVHNGKDHCSWWFPDKPLLLKMTQFESYSNSVKTRHLLIGL